MKLLTASLLLASALVPVALPAQDLALSDTFQADALNRIERVTDARVGFTAFVPESTSGALNFDPGRTTLDRAGLRPADGPAAHDYLFPRAGQSLTTLLTGVPYAAIAEYSYGITDRFSVGAIAGVLEDASPGYGVRFRYILAQPSRDFRVHFRLPIILYPQAKSFGCPGCEAWFLTWPAVNAEWRLSRGLCVWAGAGLVATACASTVFHTRNEAMERGEGVHEGRWNTLQFGFSKSLSRRTSFQLEAAAVMQGTASPPRLGSAARPSS